VLPEQKISAAVLSSGGSSSFCQLLAERLLIDALAEKGIIVDETVPTLPDAEPAPMPESMLGMAGLYGSSLSELHIKISLDGILTIDEMSSLKANYYSDGSFRDAEGTMMFTFEEDDSGNVYFHQLAYAAIPGLPPVEAANDAAVKLPTNEVPDGVWEQWLPYDGKTFFIVSEKPTSEIYLFQPFTNLAVKRNTDGYAMSRTLHENFLQPVANVPGSAGRDWQRIIVARNNEKDCLRIGDYLALSDSEVPDVYVGVDATCTIQQDGWPRWYKIGAAAGKNMKVLAPDGGWFYVYNADSIVSAATVFGDSEAVLPDSGYLCFVGDAGISFSITIG
jgi:hypothetical protein